MKTEDVCETYDELKSRVQTVLNQVIAESNRGEAYELHTVAMITYSELSDLIDFLKGN